MKELIFKIIAFVLLAHAIGGCDLTGFTPVSLENETAPPPTSPTDPPASLSVGPASFKPKVMGRFYVASLLEDIFTSTTYTSTDLRTALNKIKLASSTYGTACNVYSTYSSADCGDSIISSSNTPTSINSTVVRQLDKMVVCELIMHRGALVQAAAEKINQLDSSGALKPITNSTIPEIFKLFYRSRSASPTELQALTTFLDGLNATNETNTNKWRSVMQVICEQPGWEII